MGRELDRKNKLQLHNNTVRVLLRSIKFQIDFVLRKSSQFAFNTRPFSSFFDRARLFLVVDVSSP